MMHFLVLNLLLWYLWCKFPLLSVDYKCTLWKMLPCFECWLEPILTCPWLSHSTNISKNYYFKSSQGKGVFIGGWYIFIKLLSSMTIFFCKKTKIVPQFRYFIHVWATPCVTTRKIFSCLTGTTHRRRIMQCYVACCTVFTTFYIHNSVALLLFRAYAILKYRHEPLYKKN